MEGTTVTDNLQRAALSLSIAWRKSCDDGEILFVDYNTPDDYPTFPEAIIDTLTETARRRLRILRVRPHHHERFRSARISSLLSRWRAMSPSPLESTQSLDPFDQHGHDLCPARQGVVDGYRTRLAGWLYHLPRFEIPESLWETLDRKEPQRIIEDIRRWGRMVHLHEIVYARPEIKYDGPGDFQLILRSDLFRIHGFHEEMLHGWHVDSNIAKRLYLIYGSVGEVIDPCLASCDHTRQITPAHRHNAIQNDSQMFFEEVTLRKFQNRSITADSPTRSSKKSPCVSRRTYSSSLAGGNRHTNGGADQSPLPVGVLRPHHV